MFKKFYKWFIDLIGDRDCNSVAELVAYVKPGDVDLLNGWVKTHISYLSDSESTDEWQDLDLVMRKKKSDCEEKAAIRADVIKTWAGWCSDIVVIVHPNTDKNHAICWFDSTKAKGAMDDAGIIYGGAREMLADVIRRAWPGARYYKIKDKHGNSLCEKVFL